MGMELYGKIWLPLWMLCIYVQSAHLLILDLNCSAQALELLPDSLYTDDHTEYEYRQ